MQSRIILTFGNSQFGKSSFINTLKGEIVSEVGRGGVSKTKNVVAYDVGQSKMLFENDPDDSRLFIIDIPGFQDSEITILDENIVDLITVELLKLEQDHIDLILLFESAISSTISIRRTLDIMLKTFGEQIIESVIGLVTKWDLVDEKEAAIKREALLIFNKFPLVEWVNDTEVKKTSADLKISQLKKLSNSIKGRSLYKIHDIEKLKEEYDSLAIKMREEDPDRYEEKIESIKVIVKDSKIVKEEYLECEKRNKTNEEILARAEELRISAGTYPIQRFREITQEYDEEYKEPVWVTTYQLNQYTSWRGWRYKTITEYIPVNTQQLVSRTRRATRQVPEEYTDYEYYPIQNFLDQAMNETQEVKKYRENIVDILREEIVIKELKCEKHDFLYYKEKAMREIEKKIRILINQ